MKSIFCAFLLIAALAALPACKNDSATSGTTTDTATTTTAAPVANQPDNAAIKLEYLQDKLSESGGCRCVLFETGNDAPGAILRFSFTNPAMVMINGQLQTMEEQNPVNTAPNNRVIRVFKNENFIVSANLDPKGTVNNVKEMNEYSGEITVYNLLTKEMLSKNVTGQCGCK